LIFIPNFNEEILNVINRRIIEEQKQIFTEIFESDIDLLIGHSIIEYLDRGDFSFINQIKSLEKNMKDESKIMEKYNNNWYFLEKTGVKIINQTEFFEEKFIWEWRRLSNVRVKEQISKLLSYNKINKENYDI
jgi:hypothetical protein